MLGRQLHLSIVQELAEKVATVENDADGSFRKKPKYGFWTSSWREKTQDSDWVEWCRGNDFGDPDTCQWFLLTPRDDVKLYIIDSLADLERLMNTYVYESPIAKRIKETSGEEYARYTLGIDFERIAQDYDALHLTERGNARLHLSYPLDLNSWDSESTVWFRWCFTKVEKIAPVVAQEA